MPFRNKIFSKSSQKDKELKAQLVQMLHFKPQNIQLYQMALTHSSASNLPNIHNERLEFLGDAFLGSIVGEMLYLKYPNKDEGFLTEMRSKIVNRQNLDQLAMDIGLNKLIQFNKSDKVLLGSHIFGNALEALIGAIYLDKGYATTKQFILKYLVHPYIDLDTLEITEINFKKGIYQWAQKMHKTIDFKIIGEERIGKRRLFKVGIYLDDELWLEGTGWNKKEASQKVAEKALVMIQESEQGNNTKEDAETDK